VEVQLSGTTGRKHLFENSGNKKIRLFFYTRLIQGVGTACPDLVSESFLSKRGRAVVQSGNILYRIDREHPLQFPAYALARNQSNRAADELCGRC